MGKVRIELDQCLLRELVIDSADWPTDGPLHQLQLILQEKVDKMVMRQLYSEHVAGSEASRQEYLDRKGIPSDHRW